MGCVITTYSLADAASSHALVAELQALGFACQVEPKDQLSVTHKPDDAQDLDERIYAAVPAADIVRTVRSDESTRTSNATSRLGLKEEGEQSQRPHQLHGLT